MRFVHFLIFFGVIGLEGCRKREVSGRNRGEPSNTTSPNSAHPVSKLISPSTKLLDLQKVAGLTLRIEKDIVDVNGPRSPGYLQEGVLTTSVNGNKHFCKLSDGIQKNPAGVEKKVVSIGLSDDYAGGSIRIELEAKKSTLTRINCKLYNRKVDTMTIIDFENIVGDYFELFER